MNCPNCCIEMTQDTQRVEFEDINDNSIETKITIVWCAECKYIHTVY